MVFTTDGRQRELIGIPHLAQPAPEAPSPGATIALSGTAGLDIRVGPGTTVIVRRGDDVAIEVRAGSGPAAGRPLLAALGDALKAMVQIATG